MIDQAILQVGQTSLFSSEESHEKRNILSRKKRRSISKERTFRYETANVIQIKTTLVNMTDRLTAELNLSDKLTTIISVKIRYSNSKTQTKQLRIPQTANESILIHHAKALFDQLYNGKLKIKQIGLKCTGFVQRSDPSQSISDTRLDLPLIHQVNDIRRRFGVEKIMRATCMRELIENASALAS